MHSKVVYIKLIFLTHFFYRSVNVVFFFFCCQQRKEQEELRGVKTNHREDNEQETRDQFQLLEQLGLIQ